MAVGKRVGSKENVDRWIGGLAGRVEGRESSRPGTGRKQNGLRSSVGGWVKLWADCSPILPNSK
jgi:hypothetical protein